MSKTFFSYGAAIALVFAVSACGGGGGGDSAQQTPRYPLTVTVAPIVQSFAQFDLPNSVLATATVQGTTTASTVYVIIADPAGTFSGVPSINPASATQYLAALPLSESLAIGTHSGNLSVSICSDLQCANVLGVTSVPYTINITENPILTSTWSPSSVALTVVQTDKPVSWSIGFNQTWSGNTPYAQFSDAANIVGVAGQSGSTATMLATPNKVAISVSPTIGAGTYSGNFDMVFCRDFACKKMYRGVTRLPYTVTVVPKTNLKPLTPLAGALDWQTVQGNAAHSGYVPVTLNPANFSPRWLWTSPDPNSTPYILDPVTANNKVFTMAAPVPTAHITPVLFALDEASGTVVWTQPVPDPDNNPTSFGLGNLTPPAIAGNNVYVARTVNTYPPQEGMIFSFHTNDGSANFSPHKFTEVPGSFGEPFNEGSSGITNIGPGYLTPRASSMLLEASNSSGKTHVALDQASGISTLAWPTCALTSSSSNTFGGTVAIDAGNKAYVVANTGLILADSCQLITSAIQGPAMSAPIGDSFGPTIVPGTTDVVVAGSGMLFNFDTAKLQVKWYATGTGTGDFVGSPAVANGTVYAQSNRSVQLEARRESDGQILWTWHPPFSDELSFIGNVIATQNLVFVSTRSAVYAIDTTTHQAVWSYPYGGMRLAISANGVLYVLRGGPFATRDGMAAINLH